MGQTASLTKKLVTQPFSWLRGQRHDDESASAAGLIPKGATLYVFKRRGSMYFDEDGDLAHEFYCQVFDRNTNKVVMQKYSGDLKPQGDIDLPYPRLHGDLPVILFDTTSLQMHASNQTR
ncbi:tumor suppressor candidate 2-like [Physella acuta]|uniref:tumor suppressor candidate 2-like n=1 Tax=Physella acuta TaxID=109671 RepID=UPI0027DD7605|nr:tumor suppressor candidate 2-like [Physella acuta]XP_059157593.1 tumor suppressor candidate 2-like [Physella acuta]